MRNKFFILICFIFLSLALVRGCHSSCATCDENICLTCSTPNASVDKNKRACRCDKGFYAEDINPLKCRKDLSGKVGNACEREISLNVADFIISTMCFTQIKEAKKQEKQTTFVYSEVIVDTHKTTFNPANCNEKIKTKIEYNPSQSDNDSDYINLEALGNYVSKLPDGDKDDKLIKIPLIDIYKLAYFQSITQSGDQIVQIIKFRVLIGFARKYVRSHKWKMFVYTNRNQIQSFSVDVDIQRTQECLTSPDGCIVVADLDTDGKIVKPDWATLREDNQFTVGDWFYAKIFFKDSTYTKQLIFQKLMYKNEQGQIFDYTLLTDPAETKWSHNDNSLHVKLRLIEPSEDAIIQVSMLISTQNALLRRLQSDDEQKPDVNTQFKLTVVNPIKFYDAQYDKNPQNNSSFVVLFGLIHLMVLSLFI